MVTEVDPKSKGLIKIYAREAMNSFREGLRTCLRQFLGVQFRFYLKSI